MTGRGCAIAVLLMGCASAHAQDFGRLEPYQMVRSLQLAQDRLALGDHAALPMQRKLLELADDLFRTADAGVFENERNLTALFIYAMSGGNPTTVKVAVSRIDPRGDDKAISEALLAYTAGDLPKAAQLLAAIDPMTRGHEVGALLALVKGSLMALKNPVGALRLLDQARLLLPGTLVEEAALRRGITLCMSLRDHRRFMRAANQYTRRFLRSPYASEFADAFVEGLVAFHDEISASEIETVVSHMSRPQQEAIYLRLARRSTIKGQAERAAFASARVAELSEAADTEQDPRARLYAAVATITSNNIEESKARLEQVDAQSLSPRDRRLLAAAKAIADEVLAPPAKSPREVDHPPTPEARERSAETAARTAGEEKRNDPALSGPVGAEMEETASDLQETEADAGLISSVRDRLEAIDRMLEENAE